VEGPEKWFSVGSTSALTDDSGQVVLSSLQDVEGVGGRTDSVDFAGLLDYVTSASFV